MDYRELIKSSVEELPTLPTVYTQLLEVMEDPSSSNDKIAKVILSDQASSFKVLKVSNSLLYGLHGKVDSISQALIYLGHNEVKNIVLALSIIKLFAQGSVINFFRPADLWAHSIGVGVAARQIGLHLGEKNVENYFLAGVLHDIGKIIFLEVAPKEYQRAIELAIEKNISISDAEKSVFDLTHSQAGKILAEKWRLPQNIQDVIEFHQEGVKGFLPNKLVATIHLSNIMAHILGLGYSGHNLIPQPNAQVWNILKFRKGDLLILKDRIMDEYSNTVKQILA